MPRARLTDSPAFWLLLFAAYFAVATAMRLAGRETVGGDDAESFLWARQFAWGYGAQPPLYGWLHAVVRLFLGDTAAASAVTRAIAQTAVPCGAFLLARRFLPVRLAGVAALSVFLIHEVAQTYLRTRTHNILATGIAPLVVLAFLNWVERRRPGDAVLLGLAAGAAMLAKATAAVLIAALVIAALLRGRAAPGLPLRQAGLALAVALAVLAPYALWLALNFDVGGASLDKFAPGTDPGRGLLRLGEAAVAVLGPVLLLTGLGWPLTRPAAGPLPHRGLLLRAALSAGALVVAGVVISRAGEIKEHWLVVIFVPFVTLAVVALLRRSGWARWMPPVVAGLFAALSLARMPGYYAAQGDRVLAPFVQAAAAIARYGPDLVLAGRDANANLVIADPALPVEDWAEVRMRDCPGTVVLVAVAPQPPEPGVFAERFPQCPVLSSERVAAPPGAATPVSFAVLRLRP